ncbi:MAG: WecB/TagA/CpsF family glycosyltransferase [Anaerosomatales bacterium]|nr:WecB/TagA/CpsF family glycosyltransferase [Anaerosomatales bacterium]
MNKQSPTTADDVKRAELFGVPLDLLTMEETVRRVEELVASGGAAQHVVLNAAKVVMMRDVPRLADVIRNCEIVNADGQSIVWAGRLCGVPVPERVAGIDLMQRLLRVAESRGWPVYLLGARGEVLNVCIERIRALHPRLVVAGAHHGYFDDAAAVAEDIRRSGARVLFVGISSPKKEFLLADHLAEMGPVFAMGVGGSFDVIAGVTRRAPRWMQVAGLEWLYRLIQEPRRMWRRYLVGNVRFAWLVAQEWWRLRRVRV